MRGVSKSFRDTIDSRLYEHLIVEPAEGYWNDVLPPTIRSVHGTLPAPPTLEYVGWSAQQNTRLWPDRTMPAELRTAATERIKQAKIVDVHRLPPSTTSTRTETWLCQLLGTIETLRLFPSASGLFMDSKLVANKVIVYPTPTEPRCGATWELPSGTQKSVQHVRPQARDAGVLSVSDAMPGLAEDVWLFTGDDPVVSGPQELAEWREELLRWAREEEEAEAGANDGDSNNGDNAAAPTATAAAAQEDTREPLHGCNTAWRQLIEVGTNRVAFHAHNVSQTRLTVVGLETANPLWLGFPRMSKGKFLQQRFIRDLAQSLQEDDDLDPALVIGAMNQVRFITYAEYDKEVDPAARAVEAFPEYVSGKLACVVAPLPQS